MKINLLLCISGLFVFSFNCTTVPLPFYTWAKKDKGGKGYHYELDEFALSMKFNADSLQKKRLAKYRHPITRLCKELFYKNNLSKVQPQKDLIIPKIVHIIWVGPKTPPPIFKDCLESVKKYLPDWQCKVWMDEDIPSLRLINQKYYDQEVNYGAKSDILRYELLYTFGGVYLDVDMVLVKPLDILHYTYEFYTGLHPSPTKDVLGSAIIGSAPGHPIMKHCIDSIKDYTNIRDRLERTGPILFERSFFEVVSKKKFDRVIAFPASYFYPLEPDKKMTQDIAQYLEPESFAVHCWAGSWECRLPINTMPSRA
jgi:mannosyltransferase OCH1-like enzyme